MYHAIRHDVSAEGGSKSSQQNPGEKLSGSEAEVTTLKEALEGLKAEAIIRSELNRELLSKRMAELRSEIKSLMGNAYTRGRTGFNSAAVPSQIDIKG